MLGRAKARWRWVSRLLMVVGLARWLAARRRTTTVVEVPRGGAVVVGIENGGKK